MWAYLRCYTVYDCITVGYFIAVVFVIFVNVNMNSRSIVLTCIKSLLLFNHCICTFDFLTFVSCLLTVTLHIVDVRLTCLINITYLLTYLCLNNYTVNQAINFKVA